MEHFRAEERKQASGKYVTYHDALTSRPDVHNGVDYDSKYGKYHIPIERGRSVPSVRSIYHHDTSLSLRPCGRHVPQAL